MGGRKRLKSSEGGRKKKTKYQKRKKEKKISVYLFQSFGWELLALVGLPLFFKSIHSDLFNTSVCFKNWKYIKAKYKHISSSLFSLTKAVAKILCYLAPWDTNYTCQIRCGLLLPTSEESFVWCLTPSLRRLKSLPEVQDILIPTYLPTCLSWQKAFWLKYGSETVHLQYTPCLWHAAFIKFVKASWLTIPAPIHLWIVKCGQVHAQHLPTDSLRAQSHNSCDRPFYPCGRCDRKTKHFYWR